MELNPEKDHSLGIDIASVAFDPSFQVAAVNRRYINYACAHDGCMDTVAYGASLDKKQVIWLRTSMRKLTEAGWFTQIGPGLYQMHPLVPEHLALSQRAAKEFRLGMNHKKLLRLHTEGSLNLSIARESLMKNIANQKERKRQETMLKGMIRTLKKQGYLEATDHRGSYRLTEKAFRELSLPDKPRETPTPKDQPKGLHLTAFDAQILSILNADGRIDCRHLSQHPRHISLTKRIDTLKKHGFIIEDRLNGAITQRLKIQQELSRQMRKQLTLDLFLPEQRSLFRDIRRFEALTVSQIAEHLYGGDRELAIVDLRSMIGLKILRYDPQYEIVVLTKKGVVLTDGMDTPWMKYKTKLSSRPEEIAHDLLLYPAYKQFEKELIADGGQVIHVFNDQELRRERAIGGAFDLSTHLPDMRIHYLDGDGQERFYDIEADINYDERTIAAKISSFCRATEIGSGHHGVSTGMTWVTANLKQAQRVAKVVRTQEREISRRMRSITILVMDEDGRVRRVKW